MKYIEKYINAKASNKKYYELQVDKFTPEQKEKLNALLEKMEKAGASDPLSWAFSEIRENIPQFARFAVLKGLFDIVDDVEGNIDFACDVDERYEEDIYEVKEKLSKVIGEKQLNAFLKSYTKGVMWQVTNLLDEGNCMEDNEPGWILSELDNDGNTTNRYINGLHESLNEFEEELDIKDENL